MKEFLPLGSVVTLKNGTKRVMIVGRLQNKTGEEEIYDYASVLWPEGLVDSSHFYLFNQEDIDCMYHVGLEDIEEFNFRFRLEEECKKIRV